MRTAIRSQVCASRAPGPGSRRLYTGFVPLALVAATAIAACGTATSTHSSASSRATQAGFPKPPKISAKLKAEEAALHAQVIASIHAPPPPNIKPGIPSFIPKSTLRTNRILIATPQRPALSIQGDGIMLDLTRGRSLVTVRGPYIPSKVAGSNAPQTPASFQVVIKGTRGLVPLLPGNFSIIDAIGAVHFPVVSVVGGGEVPKAVPAGRRLTLEMRTVLPVGAGAVQYNPTGVRAFEHKSRALAAWDFNVETD
jgi:hypothetical protein